MENNAFLYKTDFVMFFRAYEVYRVTVIETTYVVWFALLSVDVFFLYIV